MTKRKILYGYHIQQGKLIPLEREAVVVRRIATLYMDGLSYQKIADTLNTDSIPFSEDASLLDNALDFADKVCYTEEKNTSMECAANDKNSIRMPRQYLQEPDG